MPRALMRRDWIVNRIDARNSYFVLLDLVCVAFHICIFTALCDFIPEWWNRVACEPFCGCSFSADNFSGSSLAKFV